MRLLTGNVVRSIPYKNRLRGYTEIVTVCYDQRVFMSGNGALHYDMAPAIIIAIPTAIPVCRLAYEQAWLTPPCTRAKYRMTIKRIMRGMSTACQVVVAVSEVCAFHANLIALRFIVGLYLYAAFS